MVSLYGLEGLGFRVGLQSFLTLSAATGFVSSFLTLMPASPCTVCIHPRRPKIAPRPPLNPRYHPTFCFMFHFLFHFVLRLEGKTLRSLYKPYTTQFDTICASLLQQPRQQGLTRPSPFPAHSQPGPQPYGTPTP